MSKRENTDLVGYIHSLSPSKMANKSFHFQIQTDSSKPRKAICFDESKYNKLKDKRISGEPIKITQAVLQPQTGNNRYAEIIVNKSSTLADVEPIQMKFSRLETEFVYINLMEDSLKVGDCVNVQASIDLSHAITSEVLIGTKRKAVMNDAILFNTTGSIHLTLWDDWIAHMQELSKKNTCFKIHSLLVKEFNGELSLSTCSDTEINVLEDQNFVKPETDKSLKPIITVGEFEFVQDIIYEFICNHCQRGFKAIEGSIVLKCNHCFTTQRIKNLEKRVLLKVKAQSIGNNYFLLNAKDLIPYVKSDPCDFKTDQDTLIMEVMELNNIEVTVDDGVVSILAPKPETSGAGKSCDFKMV